MKNNIKLLEVVPLLAIPNNNNQRYTYLSPSNLTITPGTLVRIPFANHITDGLVIGYSKSRFVKLKTVERVVSENIATQTELRWLTEFAQISCESLSLLTKSFIAVRRERSDEAAATPQTFVKRSGFSLQYTDEESFMEKFLASQKNGQSLVLVPENVFVKQITDICVKINRNYLVYNNKIPTSQKRFLLDTISKGTPDVIIASHSGIFLPFKNLTSVTIFEPAIASHRQWDMHPRYDARIGAYLKARAEKIPLLFFSTIPSFDLLTLPHLSKNTVPVLKQKVSPLIQAQNDPAIFPREIISAIKRHLEQNHQVLIFHDALGYESAYVCGACGLVLRCHLCESILQRRANNLFCATCKQNTGTVLSFCPRCNSPKIRALKTGTKALQQILQRAFAETPIVRIDRDIKAEIPKFDLTKPQITIATQKIFSFLNAPLFHYCYLPALETLINSDAYDAFEKAVISVYRIAKLLINDRAEFFIQASYDKTKILCSFAENRISELIKADLKDRKRLSLPPFTNAVFFDCQFTTPELAQKETRKIIEKIRTAYPKIQCERQTINNKKGTIGKIFLRGSSVAVQEASRLVPTKWNIDQNIFLTTITKKIKNYRPRQ